MWRSTAVNVETLYTAVIAGVLLVLRWLLKRLRVKGRLVLTLKDTDEHSKD